MYSSAVMSMCMHTDLASAMAMTDAHKPGSMAFVRPLYSVTWKIELDIHEQNGRPNARPQHECDGFKFDGCGGGGVLYAVCMLSVCCNSGVCYTGLYPYSNPNNIFQLLNNPFHTDLAQKWHK